MDIAGLALSVLQVFNSLTELGIVFASNIRSAKDFGKDAEKLSVRIVDEIERIKQLRILLLEKGKIFPDATLFEQLNRESQDNLVALLYIVTGPLLGECSGLWASYLAKSQPTQANPNGVGVQNDTNSTRDIEEMVKALSDASLDVEYQKNTGLRAKIRWVMSDKKRTMELVDELADTTRRIKDDIELFFFPLGILNSKANTLKSDLDAQKIGWSADASLARLIKDGSSTARSMEIHITDIVEDGESFVDSSCERGYFRTKPSVIQSKYYQPDQDGEADAEATASMHALAAMFKIAGDAQAEKFRLLSFAGFFQDLRRNCFRLVFQYPAGVEDEAPITLKEAFDSSIYRCPLEYRFKLAHELATVVSELHRVQWIHKNLHSENILFFSTLSPQIVGCIENKQTSKLLNGPWMVGLEHARREDGKTSLAVETKFDRCIYRHPQRWAEPFRAGRIHDVYSFGVILLEIGLWRPALSMIPEDLRRAGSNMQRGVANIRLRNKVLDEYRRMCAKELPDTMGTKYSELVLQCLNGDFNTPAQDKGEVELQKRFWIDVIDGLRKMAERI